MAAPGRSMPQVLSLLHVILTFVGGFAAGWTYMNFENERQSEDAPVPPDVSRFDHATYSTHIMVIGSHGVTLLVGGILALVTVFYPRVNTTTKGLYLLVGLYLLHLAMGVFIYSTHHWLHILLAHALTMALLFVQCVLGVWVLAHGTAWPEVQWRRLASFPTIFVLMSRVIASILALISVAQMAALHSLEDYVVVRVVCAVLAMFGVLVSLEGLVTYCMGYLAVVMEAWMGIGTSLSCVPLGIMWARMTLHVPQTIVAAALLHMVAWTFVAAREDYRDEEEDGKKSMVRKFCSRTLHCNMILMVVSLVVVLLAGCQAYQRWPEWQVCEALLVAGAGATLAQSLAVALAELVSTAYTPSPCHVGVRFLVEGLVVLAGSIMGFFSASQATFTAAVLSSAIIAILLNMVLSDRMTSAAMHAQIKVYRMFGKKSGGLLYDADSDWEFTDDEEPRDAARDKGRAFGGAVGNEVFPAALGRKHDMV